MKHQTRIPIYWTKKEFSVFWRLIVNFVTWLWWCAYMNIYGYGNIYAYIGCLTYVHLGFYHFENENLVCSTHTQTQFSLDDATNYTNACGTDAFFFHLWMFAIWYRTIKIISMIHDKPHRLLFSDLVAKKCMDHRHWNTNTNYEISDSVSKKTANFTSKWRMCVTFWCILSHDMMKN